MDAFFRLEITLKVCAPEVTLSYDKASEEDRMNTHGRIAHSVARVGD